MENQDNFNIVLVGMPGAGKTYIGNRLARLLVHFDYFDIDEEIEKKAGMSISEIFEKESQESFRALEKDVIKEISSRRNRIISVGGGAFENPENIQALKKNGLTFYLKASANELFQRIKEETHRPLFKDDLSAEAIKKMLKKREKNYLKAKFTIETDKKQAYTILDDILREYETYVKCCC